MRSHHISSFSRKVKAFHHFQEKLKHFKNIQTKKKLSITFHFHHPLYINKQNKENQNTQKSCNEKKKNFVELSSKNVKKKQSLRDRLSRKSFQKYVDSNFQINLHVTFSSSLKKQNAKFES